jgi:hypothetical protein
VKKPIAYEVIHWQDEPKTRMEIDVPDDIVREIEVKAVNRYRLAVDRFITASNATAKEKSHMKVALFSVVP